MKKVTLIITLALHCFALQAQKSPIKFGEINIIDLEMRTYAIDTTAPAVILCDFGYFDSRNFFFRRNIRIKILKKEGYDWGNRVFSTSLKTNIKASTFNLVDGKVVETKLQSNSIFVDRISETNYKTRIAMPDIREGSVIDISYGYYGLPAEWRFQDEIPILWSELYIDSANEFKLQRNIYGYYPLAKSTDNHYIAVDVPAFRKEPYMNSWTNYISKVEFDLREVYDGNTYHFLTNTWDDVFKTLMNNNYFGGAIKNNKYISEFAKEISSENLNDREKVEMAFNKIKTIKWNKEYSIFSSDMTLSTPFKNKSGNSADINLSLFRLLKSLNINSDLVLLSTRENGVILPNVPVINKLNNVIVAAYIDNDTLLLDATDNLSPFDLLPYQDINWQGRVLKESDSYWIPLSTEKKFKRDIGYNLSLSDNLMLEGSYYSISSDYAAAELRNKVAQFNSQEEFIFDVQKLREGFTISNSKINGLSDLKEKVTEEMSISIENAVEEIGGEIYIYPMLYERMMHNPFKTNDRKYPVDFGYKIQESVTVNIKLPEGYQVVSFPKSIKFQLKEKASSVIFLASGNDISISVKYLFEINKTIFLPNDYSSLQGLFNQIVLKHSEPIILKKISQ
ncbi:MAG: hypothetical protein PHV12_04580 [Bacteroidales bacterium]|nr:hypothetical protein [Bacteroidales bacterium]MDD4057985.1 hypothetical protein [Bacteroidales bacterium]